MAESILDDDDCDGEGEEETDVVVGGDILKGKEREKSRMKICGEQPNTHTHTTIKLLDRNWRPHFGALKAREQ